MKSRFMNLVCAATLASSAVLLPIIASAEATLSGNAGILSDYVF